MKIAYIITAYKNPLQLHRLIETLYYKDVSFFIHVDKKSKIELFKNKLSQLPPYYQIKWLKRERLQWGGFGIIKAIINGLSAVFMTDPSIDYIILMSEKDYPIKSVKYISSFFENHIGMSFMEFFPFPYSLWENGGMDRIQKYHFRFFGKHFELPHDYSNQSKILRLFYWLFGINFPKTRTYPKNLKPFGGSGSWYIHSRAARYILDFIVNRPDYTKFHKYSHAPDEGFFQTILMNSPEIANTIINNDLHFVEWTGKSHPRTFSTSDFSKFASSTKLFARKFDIEQDSTILDMIDYKLLNKGDLGLNHEVIDNYPSSSEENLRTKKG